MTEENKNVKNFPNYGDVPKLRFPEFTNDWRIYYLKEIAEKINNKNNDNKIVTVFSNSAVQGIVLQSDFFDKSIANKNNLGGYYIVEPFDFVYNPRLSSTADVGAMSINKTNLIGLVSPLYTVFRIKNKNISISFLEYFFKSKVWHHYMRSIANYGARDDRMNVRSEDFYNLPLTIPNYPEQIKVSKILSFIEERIQTQKKIIEQLETLMKASREKIFSQKLRFKDEQGNYFPDWDNFQLGEVLTVQGGFAFKSELFNKGITKVLRIGDIVKTIRLDDFKGVYSSEIPDNKYLVRKGDFVMALSGATFGKVGKISCNGKAYINQRVATFRTNYCLEFFYQLVQSKDFVSYIYSIPTASAQPNISNSDISKYETAIPTIKEQTKIANLLSSMQENIEIEKQILEKLELQKKFLLVNLFV